MNIEEIKETYIEHIKEYMTETGSLFPHITVFAEESEEEKPSIIHIPIPEEFMVNDESKDFFIDEIMPEVFIEIKKEFKPIGIGWAAEAWMRTADKNFDMKNYNDLPKKEVMFISVEVKDKSETFIYEINRVGKQVDFEGDLTDRIELKQIETLANPESMDGRFSGLYKKFINDQSN